MWLVNRECFLVKSLLYVNLLLNEKYIFYIEVRCFYLLFLDNWVICFLEFGFWRCVGKYLLGIDFGDFGCWYVILICVVIIKILFFCVYFMDYILCSGRSGRSGFNFFIVLFNDVVSCVKLIEISGDCGVGISI